MVQVLLTRHLFRVTTVKKKCLKSRGFIGRGEGRY